MFCYSFAITFYAVAFKFRNIFDYSTQKNIYFNLAKYILHCILVICIHSYKEPKQNLVKQSYSYYICAFCFLSFFDTILFKKLLLNTHLFKHPVMGHYPQFGEHCCPIELMINFKGQNFLGLNRNIQGTSLKSGFENLKCCRCQLLNISEIK